MKRKFGRPTSGSDNPQSKKREHRELSDKPKPEENARCKSNLRVCSWKCDRDFPDFRQPREVGCFSQDQDGVFHHDRRQLKYYVPCILRDPCFDLRQGFASMIRKDETQKVYLDDMLRWTMLNTQGFALHSERRQSNTDPSAVIQSLHTDFMCWRGLLTKLLCIPYENHEDLKFAVTKFRGTYFLCEFETEQKKESERQMPENQKEMCYWGWKFEQYVTADSEGGTPNTDRVVNNKEGFCSVVRARLKSHSLVYGGEVDAVHPRISEKNKYVELKTTRTLEYSNQIRNFKRFKLLKWWAQSFLLGISKIVSGFRDDDGVVHSIQDFQVHNIPSSIKDVHGAWKPNVCFNFLDECLTFIKQNVLVDDPRMVYLVQWSPRRDLEIQCVGRDSSYAFLPEWFINWDSWSVDRAPVEDSQP